MRGWRIIRNAALVVALVAATCGAAGGAVAQSLDQLRAQGVIGERYDGYAVARQSSPAVERAVAAINAKRRAIYAQRAQRDNVSVAQVGRVYAAHIFKQAPKGTWFLDESGRWTQR